MAPKDFARIEAVADESVDDERPVRSSTLTLLIVFIVLLVMGAFSGGFWLGRDQGVELVSSQDKARLQALIQKQERELENLRLVAKQQHKTQDVSMTQVGDLMFYNELPKQTITPSALKQKDEQQKTPPQIRAIQKMIHQEMESHPMLEEKPRQASPQASMNKPTSVPKSDAKATHAYQIQLASFQKKEDAQAFIQKIQGKNVKGRMQEVNLPKLGTWYRVYTGSYTDKPNAQKALLQLKDSIHVTGLVVSR